MEISKITDENAVMLSLSGRLDTLAAPALAKEIEEIPATCDLVLDLDALEYVSSTGLRELVRAQLKMTKRGSFSLVRVQQGVADVLRMTGLYERLNILS